MKRLLLISLVLVSSVAFASVIPAETVNPGLKLTRITFKTEKQRRAEHSKKKKTSNDTSLSERVATQNKAATNPFVFLLYRPNYILPFYNTFSPYAAVYNGHTPENQAINAAETKIQLSVQTQIIHHVLGYKNISLNMSFTQLMYWQFYDSSQFFRETDYEPQLFLHWYFNEHFLWLSGIDHQSNGKGGLMERSWNRVFNEFQLSEGNFFVSVEIWSLVFQKDSSDLHNPDIVHYLGRGSILFAYKFPWLTFTLKDGNISSLLKRGYIESTVGIPIGRFQFYIQYFNGYGQSLIEYNHRTQALGVGFALNNWI